MTTNIAFTLPAEAVEGASEAILLGDFNNWDPEKAPKLEKQTDGSFQAFAQLEEGHTYHYRFLLDDGRWVNDYNAQSYVAIPGLYVDNCVITVPASEQEENITTSSLKAEAEEKKAETTEGVEKAEPAKVKSPKKAAAKTKASATDTTAKKAKAPDKKTESKKTEKSEKAPKKTTPKEKKAKDNI